MSKTVLSHAFILREDASNGLELSAFIGRDIDRKCRLNAASPPQMLVRVSSLTATTTNYVNTHETRTSAVKKASPSITLSPPTVPQTSSSIPSNRPTAVANPAAQETTHSPPIATTATSAESIPLDPVDSASPADTLIANEAPIGTKNSDTGLLSKSSLPAPVNSQEPSNVPSASQTTASTFVAHNSQDLTSAQSPETLVVPGLSFIPSKPEPSQQPKDSALFVVNGVTVSPVYPNPALVKSNMVISGITIFAVAPSPGPVSRPPQSSVPQEPSSPGDSEPTAFSIAGTTIYRGGQGVTVSGTPILLGKSGLVVGTTTIPLVPVSISADTPIAPGNPSVFSIAGTTLTQGGSGVTVSGLRISLGPSQLIVGSRTLNFPSSVPTDYIQNIAPNPTGFSVAGTFVTHGEVITVSGTPVFVGSSNIVVGTQTVPFPSNPGNSVFSVADQTFTANPDGFLIGSTSLLSNGPAVTVSGTPVRLGASGIVIGTKTIALVSDSSLPVLTVAGTTFTANPTGFLVGSATLSPNGAPVTISGTLISLGSSDIVIGTSTIALPAAPSVLTVDGQKFTANPSGFSIGDTEIHRGGSPVTISGTLISLGSSAVVVGSSTVPFASVTNDLAPAILSGLGFTATPTPTTGDAAGNNSEPFAGAQTRIEAPMTLLAWCIGLIGLIWA